MGGSEMAGKTKVLCRNCAVVLLALFAAVVGNASAVLAAEQVEIRIGYYESTGGLGQTGKTMEALIQAFADENPQIKVSSTVAAYGTFFQKLPIELASGVGPDVWLSDGVLVDQYASQGFALELTNLIKQMGNPNDYFGIDTNRDPQGRIWAFPQGLQVSAFFYNKEMFAAAGIALPTEKWTLNDVRSYARRLTVDTDGNGVPNQYGYRSANHVTEGWFPIIKAFGGGALDETRQRSRFGDPKTIEALQWMVDMIHVDRVSPPPGTNIFNWFPQRQVATQHALYVRTFAANQAGFDYDVTIVPSGPGGRYSPVIVNSWVINAHSGGAKQQAAWDWVKFFSSEKGQRAWAELGEAVPVSRKVAVTTFMQLKLAPANRMAFVSNLDYAVPLDPNPVWSNWVNAATTALNRAFTGAIPVTEAAANADLAVQTVLDELYKK